MSRKATKKQYSSSDSVSEEEPPKKVTRKAPTKGVKKGTIKSQTRASLDAVEDKRIQNKNIQISLRSLIVIVEPKITKDQAKKIASIPWLRESFDSNMPTFNSMLTTVIKNMVGHPDQANEIIEVCRSAENYSEVEWRFPSTLHLLIEHIKRTSDLLSTEGGIPMARPCKKCGTNNWEVTFLQTSAADEAVKTIERCLTCAN